MKLMEVTSTQSMEEKRIQRVTDAAGVSIEIQIPAPGSGESVFAISPHKCGSTMLAGILQHIARHADKPFLSLTGQLFQQGYPIMKAPAEVFDIWRKPGYTFAGIRSPNPLFETDEFRRDARKILLVRDPRDVATSLYFSQAKSHGAPGRGALTASFEKTRANAQSVDINRYVLDGKANPVLNSLQRLSGLLGSQKLHVFRYEDIIFNKQEWIEEIGHVFRVSIPDALMSDLLDRYDVLPSSEDPSKHVRQVKPGNFEKHLSPEAIQYIQNRFSKVFEAFRYPLLTP